MLVERRKGKDEVAGEEGMNEERKATGSERGEGKKEDACAKVRGGGW